MDMSINDFSKMCGIGYSTARDWKEIPLWVPYVLSQLEIMKTLNIDYKEFESLNKKLQAYSAIKQIVENE